MHCAILQASFPALILCKFGGSLVKISPGIVHKKWPVWEIAIAISTQWTHTEMKELLTWHVEESCLQGRPNLPIRYSQTYKSCHFQLRCCANFTCCPTVCFCDFLLKGKLARLSAIQLINGPDTTYRQSTFNSATCAWLPLFLSTTST